MRAKGRNRSISSSRLWTVPAGRSSAANSLMGAFIVPADRRRWCFAMPFGPILRRRFYDRPAVEVARDLLGKILVHGSVAGAIVETEAYLGGDDLAAHSARGLTERTRVIFGPPGHAYVYFIYGMYECLNLVVESGGKPGCVLIRALEPVAGVGLMRRRRPAARRLDDLASGPGH